MTKETQKVMFSSAKNNWSTPQDFYDRLNKVFSFTLDPCASDENHKCEKYYTMETDGLKQSWEGETVFCNPPYDDSVTWIKKCYEESRKENTIVILLVPLRGDTGYWHDYVMKSRQIIFVKGRLKFGGSKNCAPFPSVVVIFDGSYVGEVPTIGSMPNKIKVKK